MWRKHTNLIITAVACLVILVGGLGYLLVVKSANGQEVVSPAPQSPEPNTGSTQIVPSGPRLAAWVWDSPLEWVESERDRMLEFSKQHQLAALYVRIDEYLEAFELPDKSQSQARLADLERRLVDLITQAKKEGIEVHALVGHTQWSDPELVYIPQQLLAYTQDFNTKYPNSRFAGIHFDIEFHNRDDFETDPIVRAREFLDVMEALTREKRDLPASWAIPFWFATPTETLPEFAWMGKSQLMTAHILDILKYTQGNTLTVMAYRPAAEGDKGSIAVARPTMELVQTRAPNVGVIIGQETAETKENNISFWGTDKPTLMAAIDQINAAFRSYSFYRGVAIHDLASFQKL